MAEGVEAVPEKVGDGLGHKLGPLPVWAWVVGGVVVAAGGYYLLVGRKSAGGGGGSSPFANLPNMPGVLGGDNSLTPSSNTSAPPAPTPATAAQISSALSSVASSLGITVAEAQMYWNEYLAGTAPVGSTQASGLFSNVVNAVNTILGSSAPPAPTVQNVNSNPFTSNQSWLNDILAFLPSGTSSADMNNIIAWLNGSTTTLTQTAANALNAAIGIVGQAPNPLTYTIAPAAGTGNTSFTVPQLSSIWSWWQSTAWWTTANPGSTFQSALQTLVPGLSAAGAQSIWNFTQANPTYFAANGNEYANLQALLQQLANGQALTTTGLPYQPAPTAPPPPNVKTGTSGVAQ